MKLFSFATIVFTIIKLCKNEDDFDNPIAFHMFEHHELTKEAFINEIELVYQLRQHRKNLENLYHKVLELTSENVKLEDKTTLDPLHALDILKKTSVKWPFLKRMMENITKDVKDFRLPLANATKALPKMEDFNGAIKAFINLFENYGYGVYETSKGIISYYSSSKEFKHFPSNETLEIEDFIAISEKAIQQKMFNVAIAFAKGADHLLALNPFKKSLAKAVKLLKSKLHHLNNKHLMKWKKMVGNNFITLPYLVDKDLNAAKNQPNHLMQSSKILTITNPFQYDFYFRTVCQIEGFTRHPDVSNLPKCGFLHHFDPYLRLGPFKVEVIERSPYLSILHDILTEEEIRWMIDYSKPRLSKMRLNHKRAKYERADDGHQIHKTVQCWIKDILYPEFNEFSDKFNYTINLPIMFKLAKKLELATKMNLTGKYSSTDYQTTNYGLGGLCERHLDPHGYLEGAHLPPFLKGLKQSGDMLATFMAWLGDVDGGGGTAFLHPQVERVLLPVRGSAAFWYDLDKKGSRDKRLLHGGCPVIKGSKWILNKWIYSFNQFQTFPCGIDPEEFIEPPSGHYKNQQMLTMNLHTEL